MTILSVLSIIYLGETLVLKSKDFHISIPDKINFPKIESKKESRENFKQMAFFHFKGFSPQNKESDHFNSFSCLFNTIVTLRL